MLLPAFAVSLCAALLSAGGADPPEPRVKVGDYAPPFLLKTLNPDESGLDVLSTRHHVGSTAKTPKRALLLSFAASWCKPCRRELPELAKIAKAYADRGVLVGVVVLDKDAEPIEAMRRYLVDELGFPAPVVADRFGIVGRRYGAEELPLSVLVGPDAKVAWLRSGYEEGTIAALTAELDKLAPAPDATPPEPKRKKSKRSKKKGKRGTKG